MSKTLINISEYKKRRWGENGTPPTNQSIRNMILRGEIPAEKIGRDWYINWSIIEKQTGNNLVDRVLRG